MASFLASDLASWLAVVLAVAAVIFALRRAPIYTEFSQVQLNTDTDGGPVTLKVNLTTASHAGLLKTSAKLRIAGVPVLLKMSPIDTPTNFDYRSVNTLMLVFTGESAKFKKVPATVRISIRARFSDGASAKLRCRLTITVAPQPTPGTVEPQSNNPLA